MNPIPVTHLNAPTVRNLGAAFAEDKLGDYSSMAILKMLFSVPGTKPGAVDLNSGIISSTGDRQFELTKMLLNKSLHGTLWIFRTDYHLSAILRKIARPDGNALSVSLYYPVELNGEYKVIERPLVTYSVREITTYTLKDVKEATNLNQEETEAMGFRYSIAPEPQQELEKVEDLPDEPTEAEETAPENPDTTVHQEADAGDGEEIRPLAAGDRSDYGDPDDEGDDEEDDEPIVPKKPPSVLIDCDDLKLRMQNKLLQRMNEIVDAQGLRDTDELAKLATEFLASNGVKNKVAVCKYDSKENEFVFTSEDKPTEPMNKEETPLKAEAPKEPVKVEYVIYDVNGNMRPDSVLSLTFRTAAMQIAQGYPAPLDPDKEPEYGIAGDEMIVKLRKPEITAMLPEYFEVTGVRPHLGSAYVIVINERMHEEKKEEVKEPEPEQFGKTDVNIKFVPEWENGLFEVAEEVRDKILTMTKEGLSENTPILRLGAGLDDITNATGICLDRLLANFDLGTYCEANKIRLNGVGYDENVGYTVDYTVIDEKRNAEAEAQSAAEAQEEPAPEPVPEPEVPAEQPEEPQPTTPATPAVDAESLQQEMNSDHKEEEPYLDLNDFDVRSRVIQVLFPGVVDPSMNHLRNFLTDHHIGQETASFLATKSFPTETLIIFDNLTFSIVKFKDGRYWRIFCAHTDIGLNDHSWITTRSIPGRWVQLGRDIQENNFDRGFGHRRRY